MRRRDLLKLTAAGSLLTLTGCGTNKGAAYVDGRLSMAVVTTYGTGTATYADMAAVANAVTDVKGLRTRIMTSDTAIGRLAPVRKGQATFSRTGDEYIFAFRAEYEFAGKDWGPQPTRVVWGPTAPHGLLTRENTGIRELSDIKGKKVPLITANPSVNSKIGVALKAAGLTEDDVEMVPISYGEQADGLKSGKIDFLFQQVYGSSLFELESIGYVYSVPVVAYSTTDAETVSDFVTAILDAYPKYKDATRTTRDWSPEAAVLEPQQVPFHDGLVSVLKERDLWTPAAQKKQDELLALESKLTKGWETVTADLTDDQEIAAAWSRWKDDNDV